MSEETKIEEIDRLDKPLPIWVIVSLPFLFAGIFIAIFFPVSKDWIWIEAWIIVVSFSLIMTLNYTLINVKNPRVLRNRMKLKKQGITEKTKSSAGSDLFIMPMIFIGFTGVFLFPAIDHQFQWSNVPPAVKIVGLVFANLGLISMNIAILQNAYASKILDINKEQKLIDTGLYGIVRHPLYTSAILVAISLPFALGSWIALSLAILFVVALIIRIRFEEKMLLEGMEGYKEYQKRVKYKLIPGIY